MAVTKICSVCGKMKSLTEFYKCSTSKIGVRPRCKLCEEDAKRRYRNNNREKYLAGRRKHYAENRKELIKKAERYNAKHSNEILVYRKKHYHDNRNKVFMSVKIWRKTHPEELKIQLKQRHKRILGAGGKWTLKDWLNLCKRYGDKCLRCHRADVKLTADHIIPLSKGGSNYIWNIQPLCRSCNSIKGIRSDDYRFDHRFDKSIIQTVKERMKIA